MELAWFKLIKSIFVFKSMTENMRFLGKITMYALRDRTQHVKYLLVPKWSNTCKKLSMRRLVIIHVIVGYVINKCKRVEVENTCVTVNWIHATLKVTASYIPAATVCFILIIKQQKTNSKSLSALDWRTFVALIRNKESLILTVKTMLFLLYIGLFNFSSRLLTEYFRLALKKT